MSTELCRRHLVMARINPVALFDVLFEAGLQPELVEEDTEITVACPLCEDDRPRLYVSTETASWLCFHCHAQGNLHQLLMSVVGLDGHSAFDTSRSIRLNGEDADDYFELAEDRKPEPQKITALELPGSFIPITRETPEIYLKYLARRHISPELAAARGIGYSERGYYGKRIIIPVKSDGVLYTFIARTVLAACPSCTQRLDACTCRPRKFPKVLTPPTSNGARPSLTLYNIDSVRRSASPRLVVVEGVFDALRLPTEAVALLGSSASSTQVALIAGIARGRPVTLCLDGDEAGYKGALKVADLLIGEMVRVNVALLPEGADPGSLPMDELEGYLSKARPYVI